MKTITRSPEETEKLGKKFANDLHPKDVVFLIGNLGSGKTTFTKGIARGLGITSRIISPTFTVVRTHLTNSRQIETLYHLDLYRLQSKEEALGVDIKDYLEDEKGVVVIEWPEISQNIVKGTVWKVFFEDLNDTRSIEIRKEL